MNKNWLIYLFYVSLGILIAMAIRESISIAWYLLEGDRTSGKVVRFENDMSNRTKSIRRPIFEYQVNGVTYTIKAEASSDLQFELNDTETILSIPGNPENAKISTFLELWLASFLYLFVALALIAISFAVRMIFHFKI